MTTQNERLRAALWEARTAVDWRVGGLRDRLSADRADRIRDRIDAVLAEPDEGGSVRRVRELEAILAFQKDMNASDLRLLRATEAALDSTQVVIDRMNKELSEARAEVERAYRRGAEAMREAAADLFQGNKPGLAAIPTWSVFIRALPIPEDKP